MPSLARITSTFFTSLINRLGVRPPPDEGYLLSNVVTPVSLVDSDITLSAQVTTLNCSSPATQGELAAPVAATLLADTGPLAAGTYNVLLMAGASIGGNFNIDFRLQRRDAANAATIWGQLFSINVNGAQNLVIPFRLTVADQERLRAISVTNSIAASLYQVSIFSEKVT